MALLHDGKDVIDKEYKEFTAKMWAKGHSFFLYLSDNADSLSSCCFSKDQKVLWKSSTEGVKLTTLKELYDTKYEPHKKNLKIFHNGSWVSGKAIKLPNRSMYKVVTENNKEFFMTDNHINVTLEGEKQTSKLTTNDYLMFNTIALNAIHENNEHLTYEQGFTIGAFLGDGSFGTRHEGGKIYDVNFSQNEHKYAKCVEMINAANKQLGSNTTCKLSAIHNNVYPVRISSEKLANFIRKWTNWKEGTLYYNKELNLNCLLQSIEFRKGILDGWYNTDGGNSNRCYTTSQKLAECMEVLITSLGMQSIIDISDRTDEKCVIRGVEYNRNYPLYCVRWYEPANHRSNKTEVKTWIKRNNSIYFKIKSIEKVYYTDEVYCIECKNQDEPYFTLPSGLITHNCRLRNVITDNTFSFTNGLTGVMTGSVNVITLNLNRIIQDYCRKVGNRTIEAIKTPEFEAYFNDILDRVAKYHIAYKTLVYEVEKAGMLSASNAGYIKIEKLYSTIGINGFNEAAEYLGCACRFYDSQYHEFNHIILGLIDKKIKTLNAIDRKFLFNCEFVPQHRGHVKPLVIDLKLQKWTIRGKQYNRAA